MTASPVLVGLAPGVTVTESVVDLPASTDQGFADPMAVRILRVLFVSSIVRERALAAIAVRHRILH